MHEKTEFTHVYYAEIPQEIKIGKVYPESRDEEIKSCKSEKTRAEKYFVWRLLEYAVKKSLGLDFKALNFTKTEYGKWVTEGFYFSLSHSEGLAAVAVSSSPVGVDIEAVKERNYERLEKRAFSPEERRSFYLLPEEERGEKFTLLWAKKESVFKMRNLPEFIPSETDGASAEARLLTLEGGRYALAVSHQTKNVIFSYKCHPV